MLPTQLLKVLVFLAVSAESKSACCAEVGHDGFHNLLIPLISMEIR
jgi:hypothetical protein